MCLNECTIFVVILRVFDYRDIYKEQCQFHGALVLSSNELI